MQPAPSTKTTMLDVLREAPRGSRAGRGIALILSLSIAMPSIVAHPSAAIAAPSRPKSVRDLLSADAKKQWDTALALAQRNQWDGARAAFLQAYELSKNPRVLFNVAVSEKNLGHYPQAIDTFRRELDEGKGQLSPDEEAEINTAIVGLEKYVMTIAIDVSEPGARVFVDDIEVGVSPLKSPVTVAIGSHRVRATKAGSVDAQAYVDGKERAPRVSLKLESNIKTARVTIQVAGPKSAVVKIDGREVGSATPTMPYNGVVDVRPDPHEFSAEAADFVTAKQSAIVREGEALNLVLQLSPEQQKGKLIVQTQPDGATIEIDGAVVGATKWEGPVSVGRHQITVKKPKYYPWTYDVEVPKGGERAVSASLNEDRNTSFVPWLIGTVLVIGASTAAVYFLTRPKDQEPVNGSLPPYTVGTPSVRF